ncbi:MAG: hypothetical protein IJ600_07380 [Lachnospiraceae bacterium]|nr:hypothetical protein [Lachnospiraceae bacterium]
MAVSVPEVKAKVAVYVEVADRQYDLDEVKERVRKDYEAGNKGEMKDLKLYVKPEDGKAYYTVNGGKVSGSVDL